MACGSNICQPCHGPVHGTSSKGPDAQAAPMCVFCHRYQHKVGWPEFERLYGFIRAEKAAEWWKRFKEQR